MMVVLLPKLLDLITDVSSFKMASGKKIMLGAAEETISGDGTDITFEVGSSGDINIPANIGLTLTMMIPKRLNGCNRFNNFK